MATATPPWNRKFPNWDRVIDDSIPLICTLLFGFSGTFFAAIAAADGAVLGSFTPTPILNRWVIPQIGVKSAILVVLGAASIAFFASVIAAIYSKLSDADASRASVEAVARDDDQKACDTLALADFHARQEQLRKVSISAFNAGVFLLPISGLLLLPKLASGIALVVYIAVSVFFFLKTR